MEEETAAKLILDGLERGDLIIRWRDKLEAKQTSFSYNELINQGEKLEFLVEVCAGCGRENCDCPCGTSLNWKD
jgi:hypothetical protein